MSFPQQEFTFRFDSSLRLPASGYQNDVLCDDCVKLDLEESFANAFDLYEGARRGRNSRKLKVYRADNGPAYLGYFYYVTSLSDRLSHSTDCKLCKFLKQTCPDPRKGTFKLLAICTSESYLFKVQEKTKRKDRRPWDEVDHNVFLALIPEVPLIPKCGIPLRWFETELPKIGAIYRLTPWTADERMRLALPRPVEPKADIGLARGWLDCCRQSHRFCAPKKVVGAVLPGFRVINCTNREIEERPWSEKYVALSYAWGLLPPLPGEWPKTICDAIEVTKQLGEKYLWVDRVCIDQSNMQEKQILISKMDAIYESAEFTIVAGAGDAHTGLSGVTTRTRNLQPRVELKKGAQPPSNILNNLATATADPYIKLLGITTEEYEETFKYREWLDLHRFGIKSTVTLDAKYMEEFEKEEAIMKTYNISHEHLTAFQDFADDNKCSIDKWMLEMKEWAQEIGIELQQLAPLMLRECAIQLGMPAHLIGTLKRRPTPPITHPSKLEKPLPPGEISGTTILISALEDPRVTIRNCNWATRGWTYQEGVLSNRRLVFTEQQMYWECNGMATNESLNILDLRDQSQTRFADYMLSGIFDGDIHRVPELQYGFKASDVEEVSEQIMKLDSHIRAFTSRKIKCEDDSLNAFLGVAARYSTNSALNLLLGMPVWAGLFATGKPGLQDTFALSVSTWTHVGQPVVMGAEMYVAECTRRSKFPSWTWVGWEGRADFSTTTSAGENDDDPPGWEDTIHVKFFEAMTNNDWATGVNPVWSAEIMLHASDGSEATLLVGHAPVVNTAVDQSKTWLLTIRQPLVLRHMILMHSTKEGEWRRLMGKQVQIHLSVPYKEVELTVGHKNGDMVTVFIFASMVPKIFNGTARYLILRKADNAGTRWERIGRLAMTFEEWELEEYKNTAELVTAMPVKKFGRDIVLI